MERVRRLNDLWSWLPAFRAVAETEHLPSASKALFVSPSALSRTIGLLEEAVGRPLFDRVGRRIVLNDAGHDLLAHVRDAMRLVDEGLQRLESRQLVGAVDVSVAAPLAPAFVLPALAPLAAAHPEIVVRVTSFVSPQVGDLLRQGRVDLALLDDPLPAEGVFVEPLAILHHSVWCHPAHPLAAAARATLADVAAHPFAAPVADAQGVTADGWPLHLERSVALRVTHMQVALDAVRDQALIAVLPDVAARRHGLHRVMLDVRPPSTLYLAQRTPLPVPSRISAVADAIRAVARGVESSEPPRR